MCADFLKISKCLQIPLSTLCDFDIKFSDHLASDSFQFCGFKLIQIDRHEAKSSFQLFFEKGKVQSITSTETSTGYSKVCQYSFHQEVVSYSPLRNKLKFKAGEQIEPELKAFFEARIQRTLPCKTCISTDYDFDCIEVSQPCTTEREYRPKFPRNTDEWYNIAKQSADGSIPVLTLILDFETITRTPPCDDSEFPNEFSYSDHQYQTVKHHFNVVHLKAISVIKRLGHKLLIIHRNIPFRILYRFFLEFEILITHEQCRTSEGNNKDLCLLFPELNFKHRCYHDHLLISEKFDQVQLHLLTEKKVDDNFVQLCASGFDHTPTLGHERMILPHDVDSWLAQACSHSRFGSNLYLCVTVMNILIFDENSKIKPLEYQKTNNPTEKSFYYDSNVVTQLGNFAHRGFALCVCNDSGRTDDQLQSLLTNLANTKAHLLTMEATDDKESSFEELVAKKIITHITPRPELLIINSVSSLRIDDILTLTLEREEIFPLFGRKKVHQTVDVHFEKLANQNAPKTKKQWFTRSRKNISEDKTSQIVAVCDLDETLVSFNNKTGRFNKEMKFPQMGSCKAHSWFYDKAALKIIARFSENGHRVVVMTLGSYVFEKAKRLFRIVNIELQEEDFHSAADIPNGNKAAHLDNQIYAPRAMLFDDRQSNQPSISFFELVDSFKSFIDFSAQQEPVIGAQKDDDLPLPSKEKKYDPKSKLVVGTSPKSPSHKSKKKQ